MMPLRPNHLWYDLHCHLHSGRFLLGLLAVTGFLILFVNFSLVYPTIGLFGLLFALRALIGRRCPHCDRSLKEMTAVRDKENAFILHITWQCPVDGYEETETTKGDAGLFGVS